MHTAALVAKNGSIDWFCAPRFDSPACFAALLGDEQNGRWSIAPAETIRECRRQYRTGTLTLETTFVCDDGEVLLVDMMIAEREHSRIVREVRGIRGTVAMRLEYIVRYDYGSIVPWVERLEDGLRAVAGSSGLWLASDVELGPEGMKTVGNFEVAQGDRLGFQLTAFPSYGPDPIPWVDQDEIDLAERWWRKWSAQCAYDGPYEDIVRRSFLTLKALTFDPTGAIVAAPTTSLPEQIGCVRNCDYRFCWLRDATFTLYALIAGDYHDSARAWRAWLLRAVAGDPEVLQIVYDIRADRRLPEVELPWLAGYDDSKPVRIGNGAHDQFQLDVYGEVVDLLYVAHKFDIAPAFDNEWALFKAIVGTVERRWSDPDRGLWEIRGEPQHFTHSKVMAWVALDRAVRGVEEFGLDGPVEQWRAVRGKIHADVCKNAFNAERNAFMQAYGSTQLDASVLLLPIVGFLPADDPRVAGTIAEIERVLIDADGFVARYTQNEDTNTDGLPPGEGAFLACSFWLVDNYVLANRLPDAQALFERLAALCNDVGLLSEEYDGKAKRLVGNFPQAFSHVGLINSAFNIWHATQPVINRSDGRA